MRKFLITIGQRNAPRLTFEALAVDSCTAAHQHVCLVEPGERLDVKAVDLAMLADKQADGYWTRLCAGAREIDLRERGACLTDVAERALDAEPERDVPHLSTDLHDRRGLGNNAHVHERVGRPLTRRLGVRPAGAGEKRHRDDGGSHGAGRVE